VKIWSARKIFLEREKIFFGALQIFIASRAKKKAGPRITAKTCPKL
jgi:hypothetical protein